PVAEPLLERAVGGLAGRLEDAAVHVEDPAVIAAADAALLEDAVLERGPAVGALQLQQAGAARAVAEDHEVLAHDPDAPRHVSEVAREGHRLPEPSQVLAARRAGIGARSEEHTSELQSRFDLVCRLLLEK